MSGPKVGTVVVGGAAIPIATIALVGYGLYQGAKAVTEGVHKAIAEHEKHKGDMRREVDVQERSVDSLLTNGESRWQNEKRELDTLRKNVERELSQLRQSAGTPQSKKEAEETFRNAESLLAEAENRQRQFQLQRSNAATKFNEARRQCGASQRTVRSSLTEGKNAANQAVSAINVAVESARSAKLVYADVLLITQQKAATERQQEILRQKAQSSIDGAKAEITPETMTGVQDWLGEEATTMIRASVEQAEQELRRKNYENSAKLAQESVAMYRQFYHTAMQTKQKFEHREIIADAIAAALLDLQYDEPDINYEPKEGQENAMLGNITIFAKSKGESGDMRLAIDLDGAINLEVADIPDGKESECHQRLTDLQSKVADVVDFEITDWGRAKDVKPQASGTMFKQRVQQQEQVKRRQS